MLIARRPGVNFAHAKLTPGGRNDSATGDRSAPWKKKKDVENTCNGHGIHTVYTVRRGKSNQVMIQAPTMGYHETKMEC